jgi:hypothetical protein
MNKRQLPAYLAGATLLLGACSAFDPKNTNPYCGEAIDFHRVLLVDMTSYNMQEERISQALREQLGEYRLVTDKPVQIPRDYAFWNRDNVKGIAGAKAEAAEWGCNLLVLLETRAARSSVGGLQGRTDDLVWLVHVGTISQ